jgi:hypothetical protein
LYGGFGPAHHQSHRGREIFWIPRFVEQRQIDSHRPWKIGGFLGVPFVLPRFFLFQLLIQFRGGSAGCLGRRFSGVKIDEVESYHILAEDIQGAADFQLAIGACVFTPHQDTRVVFVEIVADFREISFGNIPS